MNVEEFFRPTRGKIILSITLFLLFPVPFKVTELGGPNECNGLKTCVLGEHNDWFIFGGLFFIFALFYRGNQAFMTDTDYLWKFPYLVITSYIISCLIIEIYNRLMVKK